MRLSEDVMRPLDPEVWFGRLEPRFAYRLGRFLQFVWMSGFDVKMVEGFRRSARQRYLYSIGRTIEKQAPVVTDTRRSLHEGGRAMDVCDRVHGWDSPALFEFMKRHAGEFGLRSLPADRGHLEEVS